MFKFISSSILFCLYFTVNAQEKRDISWIENNLKEKVQVGEKSKTYSIQEKMKASNIPGASVVVVRDGKVVLNNGYGIANELTGTKVNEHTLFQAGSISKPVAALAVFKLVQQGKLDLDTDVNQYLKTWKIPKSKYTKKEKVTLRQLLSHTAGLNVHGFPGYPLGADIPSTEDVLNGKGNTSEVKVITTPGEKWEYSGGGYTIMQLVVEDVSGMPFHEFMDKKILPEIGMTESTYSYNLSGEKKKLASAAYEMNGDIYGEPWNNYPESAAAGLWTTGADLAKFCLFIQKDEAERREGSISGELIREMLTPGKGNWGLGLSISGEGPELRFGHGGKNAGFTNDMYAFKNKKDAIIILTNGDNGSALISDIHYAVSNFYNWNVYNYVIASPIKLKADIIEKYTGMFMLDINGRKAKVKSELVNGTLFLSSKKLPGKLELTPISENKFIEINRGMQIDFFQNTDNEVTYFLFNEKFKAKKL